MNLTPEEQRLIQKLRERSAGTAETTGPAEHLIIVRESSKKAISADADLSEYQKMSQQILDRPDVRSLPGADTIRALAVDIVREDRRAREIREQLGAEAIMDGRITVGHKIRVANVVYILAVFSAAKTKMKIEDDLISIENSFSDAVARTVERHKIKQLHTGPFHRLVRHKKASEKLETALQKNKTTVHYAGGEIEMGTEAGDMNWTLQVVIAEAQYKGTVAGLTNGAHALLEAGQWPKAESQLPAAGYKLASDTDSTVIPDPAQIDLVRDIIEWAADENLTDLDIARKLAEKHQYASGVLRARSGSSTIMDARYPATAVRNLLRKGLPLWETGTYTYETEIPQHMESAKLRGGTLARVEERNGIRIASFDLDFGHQHLPEGRWADPETIERAKTLRASAPGAQAKPVGRAAAGSDRKPLSGIAEWTEGDTQYRLTSRHKEQYRIVARDAKLATDSNGRTTGWATEDYDTVLAAIDPAETHRAIADAIIEALDTGGVQWARTAAGPSDIDTAGAEELLARLTGKADDLTRALANAEQDYELAREIGATETMKDRLQATESLRRQLTEAREEIARKQGSISDLRELAEGTKVDAAAIAAAMAKLAGTEKASDPAFNEHLRELLVDLQAKPAEDGLTVTLTTRLRIQSSDGQLIVGPISATVKNRQRKLADQRSTALFEKVFRDGQRFETAAREVGYTDLEAARRRLRAQLEDTGIVQTKGLRSAALNAPHPDVRRIIWAEHEARRTGRPFRTPKGIPAAYAQHVRATYTSRTQWAQYWCDDATATQTAVDIAAEHGPEGIRWDDLIDRLATQNPDAVSRHALAELTLGRGAGHANRIAFEPALDRDELWHRHNKKRKIRARTCPHCDKQTLTHIVRAPEVPGGIICTECRRTAGGDRSIRMPDWYLERWVGPRGIAKNADSRKTGTTLT